VKAEEKSAFDNDDDSISAAAAYDAIDISRPVSQTTLVNHCHVDDVREIPWMTSSSLVLLPNCRVPRCGLVRCQSLRAIFAKMSTYTLHSSALRTA